MVKWFIMVKPESLKIPQKRKKILKMCQVSILFYRDKNHSLLENVLQK